MAANALPPPPIQDKPGSFTWLEWYRQLRAYVSTSGSVPWYVINFAGSNITDIALRDHDHLQSLQGGTAGEHYHLTAAQIAALGIHNSLTGLQGGTTNEYYHVTNTEYTALTGSTQGTWTPTFTNLTVVNGTGGATYSGRYSRIGRTVFYTIKIVCTGTATTASVAGTTYCTLPIAATQDDTVDVANATTRLSVGSGYLDSTNDRCYPATWTATGNTIIISGKYEV
ncbi:MAG TPA: hypothetical protein PLT51_03555 [Candidatus Dojkabacteria bacterium]|nr:hypothetical protein [Candidatus Dojkabacteria bacterium]